MGLGAAARRGTHGRMGVHKRRQKGEGSTSKKAERGQVVFLLAAPRLRGGGQVVLREGQDLATHAKKRMRRVAGKCART